MKSKNKGFTLIELLIVVAIIGLLATLAIVSLTSAQQRARDTKRVADIKSIQTALELYWNENAAYPIVDVDDGNAANGDEVTTWVELGTQMSNFISGIPTDPNHNDDIFYQYAMDVSTDNAYYISAQLENENHQALTQDLESASNVGAGSTDWNMLTSNDGMTISDCNGDGTAETTCQTIAAAAVDCTDTAGSAGYCIYGVAATD